MEVEDVSPALQERLGPEATAALVELLDRAKQECTMEITMAIVERFERRLSDECGETRREMRALHMQSREEMLAGDANLRLEMTRGFSSIREDMGTLKFDLLKWSFAFWIAQMVSVVAIVGLMLQAMHT